MRLTGAIGKASLGPNAASALTLLRVFSRTPPLRQGLNSPSHSLQMPYSGGSYIYLRESYGKDKWGRLVAFLYIFQFLISAPIEIASGFLAMSQYLAYVTRITNTVYNSLIAAGFCVVSVGVLYQDLSFVGKLSIILWIGTVGAIIFSIVAGFMNFNPELLALPDDFPPSAPSGWASFFFTLGTATRIGLYDFAGYYDACQMAGKGNLLNL